MANEATARLAGLAFLILTLSVGAALAQSASRETGLKLSGDQPIQIESDRLEVRENESLAVFTGNVNVVQGETLMKSGRMVVHYASGGGSAATGSSEIERIEVDGKVYVRSESQVATGDSGTFNMKTEELVLLGKEVVLTEGDNVVVGCRLTVQMATGQARLDGCGGSAAGSGRVKMLLQPNSQRPQN